MKAYLQTHDSPDAQSTAAEIKQLDPNSTLPGRAMGNSLIKSGNAAANAKNTTHGAHRLRSGRRQGDPEVAVTANTLAAFAIARWTKPDYKRMQAYAEKALAIKPNDAAGKFCRRHRIHRRSGRRVTTTPRRRRPRPRSTKPTSKPKPRATKHSHFRSRRSSKRISMPHPQPNREAAANVTRTLNGYRPMARPHGAGDGRQNSSSGGS